MRMANDTFYVEIVRGILATDFTLLTPADSTTLLVAGSPAQTVDIRWTPTTTNGSTPIYEFLLDNVGGDFMPPALFIPSNLSGTDTVLTLTYGQLDAALANLGLNIGDTLNAIWTVRAISSGDTLMADTVFSINLVRGALFAGDFNLTSPASGTIVNLQGLAASTPINITWDSLDANGPVIYTWLATTPAGTFNIPLLAVLSNNSGADTVLTLTAGQIENVLDTLNIEGGDTATFQWTVIGLVGTDTAYAADTFAVSFVRAITFSAFNLIAPANNISLTVAGLPTDEVNISWDSTMVNNANATTYSFLLDSLNGNFAPLPLLILPSNNGGQDTVLTVTMAALDLALSNLGVAVGDSLVGKWTVRAANGGQTAYAADTFNITLIRGVLTGLSQRMEAATNIEVYPNPAADFINIELSGLPAGGATATMIDVSGRALLSQRVGEGTSRLSVAGLPAGTYFLKLQSSKGQTVRKVVVTQ